MATRRIRRPAAGARILQETGSHASETADRGPHGAPTVRPTAHRPFFSCNNQANGSHCDVRRRRRQKPGPRRRPRCRADRPFAAGRAVRGLRRAFRLRPRGRPAALLVRDDAAAAGAADRAGAALPVSGLPAAPAGAGGGVSGLRQWPMSAAHVSGRINPAHPRRAPIRSTALPPRRARPARHHRAAAPSVRAPQSRQGRHGPSTARPASARRPPPR